MQKRHTNRLQYFNELATTTEKYIIPFIETLRPITPSMQVLEIGCGEGGNLLPFVRKGCQVVGCDMSPSRIEEAREFFKNENQAQITLIASDVFLLKEMYHRFDLVIIHDVIEHIEEKESFMQHVKDFLAPDAILFVGFPAWQMPFGGHQQICSSKLISHLPFIHLLPNFLYTALLRGGGESDKKIEEMLQIKRSRTSIECFNKLINKLEYKPLKSCYYFINPHYETKFGLQPRQLWTLIGKIPYLRNFFTTSAFYILQTKPEK